MYEAGQRKVIGEAVVDTDGPYLDISAKVVDPEYQARIGGNVDSAFSLGPFSSTKNEKDDAPRPFEVAYIPPIRIKGQHPKI